MEACISAKCRANARASTCRPEPPFASATGPLLEVFSRQLGIYFHCFTPSRAGFFALAGRLESVAQVSQSRRKIGLNFRRQLVALGSSVGISGGLQQEAQVV